MKKILKSSIILAAIMSSALSCQKEDVDVKGVVGDFAYIVDGTEAMYHASHCEVFHTPDGEEGEVSKTISVALTKVQDSDVAVTLTTDTKVSAGYTAIPESVLKYDREIVIPAGEKSVDVDIKIENSDFSKLVDVDYMALFRIVTAGDLKVSTNSNAAFIVVRALTVDPADNLVRIDAAEKSYSVKNYLDQTTGDKISYSFTVSGSVEAYDEFVATLAVDNSLIAAYNEAHGTELQPLPADLAYNLPAVTVAKNGTSAGASFSIENADRSKLTDERGYLVPIVLSDVGRASIAPATGVIYLVINVVNFDYSSAFHAALYLGNPDMATNYVFSQPLDMSTGFTYVLHIFIDEITAHSRIADFCDANENFINMLRLGQEGVKVDEEGVKTTNLEWFVGPNGTRKKLYTGELKEKTWYHIVLRYSASEKKLSLYLNNSLSHSTRSTETLTDEEVAAFANCKFQRFEFNSSWGGPGYRNGNEFKGRIWKVAVFNKPLYTGYIRYTKNDMNSAFISNTAYGMMAYWKFEEGYGHVVKEETGRYESIDFSKTSRDDGDGVMKDVDVSQHIKWVADEYNQH